MLQTTLAIYYLLSFTAQENPTAEIRINQAGKSIVLTGRILEEASADNGVLLQTCEGRLWPLQAERIEHKQYKTDEFEPVARKQYGRDLRSELGEDFKILEAANFVLVYNTEKAYARWVSGLYKKFERGFKGFWNKGKHKFKLVSKPEFPLAVIIFKSRPEYEKYMADDLGMVNPAMLAYYNLETNRVVMFDLTARDFQIQGEVNDRRINEVLNNPKAIHMVATIIHEGTHQLMFNYGMQVRYSDTPLWLNEGMAMFFETPDLTAERGWRAIGELNFIRLGQFLNYVQRRPEDSLKSMLTSDDGFRGEAALDIYSQAWAFNFFLLKKYRGSFIEYLKFMSNKKVLRYDKPEQRLADFEQHFQTPLQELDREFLRYFQSLNR